MEFNESKLELSRQLEERMDVYEMRNTKGWDATRRHLQMLINVNTDALVNCTDAEFIRYQERLRAFTSLLEYVEDNLGVTDSIRDDLRKLTEEEDYNEQYALNV